MSFAYLTKDLMRNLNFCVISLSLNNNVGITISSIGTNRKKKCISSVPRLLSCEFLKRDISLFVTKIFLRHSVVLYGYCL